MNDATPESARDLFGQLRSLMNTAPARQSKQWRDDVFELLCSAYELDARAYKDQWLPYLISFRRHWQHPLQVVGSFDELRDAALVAPFARFDVRLVRGRGYEGSVALVRDPLLDRVDELDLEANEFHCSGVIEITRTLSQPTLRSLNLANNSIGARGAMALGRAPSMSGLERLDLRHNHIGPRGLDALIESPYLRNLTYLNLRQNGLWPSQKAKVRESRLGRVALV